MLNSMILKAEQFCRPIITDVREEAAEYLSPVFRRSFAHGSGYH